MVAASIDTVTVDLGGCGKGNGWRATGSSIAFPGFMQVHQEGDNMLTSNPTNMTERLLPPLKVGDSVTLETIKNQQHFTEPPPRYSEATLIKTLEEHGIGRPSTYASIIDTLQHRHYAILDKKRFTPTDIGEIVTQFLNDYFTTYVDYGFTADLETNLMLSHAVKKNGSLC